MGLVLAVIMLVKAYTNGLALSLSVALFAGSPDFGTAGPFLPFHLLVAFGGLTGSLVLLRNFKPKTLEAL